MHLHATTDDKPIYQSIGEYLVKTAVYTPFYFLGIAFVAFPFAIIMVGGGDPVMNGIIFLSFSGLALLAGQFEALGENPESNAERSVLTEGLVAIATVLYYNVITAFTLVFAYSLYLSGYPTLGGITAMLAPVVDVLATKYYNIGIANAMLGLAYDTGEWTASVFEKIPFRQTLARVVRGIGMAADSLSQLLHNFLLPSMQTRRRRLQ